MFHKFLLGNDILLKIIYEDFNREINNLMSYLRKYKNGFVSVCSLIKVKLVIKNRREISKIYEILKNYNIKLWKVPSYVDLNELIESEDIEEAFLIYTAKSLNAYLLTEKEGLLKNYEKAITVKEAINLIENAEKNRKVLFLNLPKQNTDVYPFIEQKLDDIITNAKFISGLYVKNFEKKFANYLGTKYCIGVNSGTSALIVALMAIGLKPGDEVILPVNTFIATAEAVAILGGKPVFVDIHPDYYTIDTNQIERKITPKTKAIIPVHLYGQCVDMEPIMKLAEKYNLWVIEDACQAHGAEYKGKKAGTIGHIGCFSFYPGKNLGAWGEAGACVTNDGKLAERMYKIRNHGGIEKYQHDILGGNFRMEEIQGAVLSEKINFLDIWNTKRRKVAELYKKYLKPLEARGLIKLPKEAPYNKHIFHLFVINILKGNREIILKNLKNKGVECSIHYPKPLHQIQPFQDKNIYPVAEQVQKNVISLPINEHLTEEDVKFISKVLTEVLNGR